MAVAPLAQQDEPGEDEFGLVGHNSKWVKPMGTTVEIGRVDPITRAMHPGGPLHGGRGAEIVQSFEHHPATPPPPYDNGFLPKHAMLPTETEVSACVGPPYHFISFYSSPLCCCAQVAVWEAKEAAQAEAEAEAAARRRPYRPRKRRRSGRIAPRRRAAQAVPVLPRTHALQARLLPSRRRPLLAVTCQRAAA